MNRDSVQLGPGGTFYADQLLGLVFLYNFLHILYYNVPCFPPILSIAILCVQVNVIGHENTVKS